MNNLILYSIMERFFNYFSILHKMKKYISALRFITLLFLPLFSFANMAQTYFAGTDHSSLYLVSDKENDNGCVVKKENLYIKIDKNKEKSKFSAYFADFTAKYIINSDKKQRISLIFIAQNIIGTHSITINGQKIKNIPLNPDENYPFLQKEVKENTVFYFVKFKDNQVYFSDYINDLIFFEADLTEGENVININYNANLSIDTSGFLPKYELNYAIYPSQYWNTFPPIEIEMQIPDYLQVRSNNIREGKEKENIIKWDVKNLSIGTLEWVFTKKTTWLQDLVLLISPVGFMFITIFICFIFHILLIKKLQHFKLNLLDFIVSPIIGYTVYFLSYPFIEWVIDTKGGNHGYFFLFIFTIILAIPIYGLFVIAFTLNIFKKVKINVSVGIAVLAFALSFLLLLDETENIIICSLLMIGSILVYTLSKKTRVKSFYLGTIFFISLLILLWELIQNL